MQDINLLGIDTSKTIFQLHGINKIGKCMLKKRISRELLIETVAKIPVCTIVIEACGGSNFWAREFEKFDHNVKLISPQFVKPFVKGNKTDRNDAEAITEAASRPEMRFVSKKSIEQQDIQSIHRIRERVVQQQTALCNQIRGILAEYGIVIRQGISSLRKSLPIILENKEDKLSLFMLRHMQKLQEELSAYEEKVTFYDKEIIKIYKASESGKKIGQIEGVGPMIATAILALGNLKEFKNGRHFAAFLGLVPREYSSGKKQRLLGITKRGNSYVRTLLIHGARSVVLRCDKKNDPKSLWIKNLINRRGINRTCCALANKTARIIWALLTTDEAYDKYKACAT